MKITKKKTSPNLLFSKKSNVSIEYEQIGLQLKNWMFMVLRYNLCKITWFWYVCSILIADFFYSMEFDHLLNNFSVDFS